VCHSGHPQVGPPARKRVRAQWTRWALAWRIDGLRGLAEAAKATLLLCLLTLLRTYLQLKVANFLANGAVHLGCVTLNEDPGPCLALWNLVWLLLFGLWLCWILLLAAWHFGRRVAVCSRVRTVDYV
jgi:hypothetical protein